MTTTALINDIIQTNNTEMRRRVQHLNQINGQKWVINHYFHILTTHPRKILYPSIAQILPLLFQRGNAGPQVTHCDFHRPKLQHSINKLRAILSRSSYSFCRRALSLFLCWPFLE